MPSMMLVAAAVALLADSTNSCSTARGVDAAAAVRRAADVTGLTRSRGRILHQNAFDVVQHPYESDRMYAPYLAEVRKLDDWLDPSTGTERLTGFTTIGGYEYSAGTTIGDALASYGVRDTTVAPDGQVHAALFATRPLNAWAMLADWLAATDVRVEGRCQSRDYARLVLNRNGASGVERLFLDEKSGYPIKLERTEAHYLWGQLRVEFVYSTWTRVGDAHVPGGSFRIEDGTTIIARTFGGSKLVSRDSAPSFAMPAHSAPMAMQIADFLAPTKPDTVRVSATTYLLRNRGYTETVTLARDTVFVFDATQGDERARQDSLWIAALFPGKHAIAVVVTDIAWPHVAGVRAWVARGATIISHTAAHDFLTQVVKRRWTLAPDLLEQRGAHSPLHFRAVSDSTSIGGGNILLFPIDGASSEVALAAFVRSDRFLWASDFLQNLRAPTQYLDEVHAAVQRVGVSPLKVAAEHAPLAPWDRVASLAEGARQPVP